MTTKIRILLVDLWEGPGHAYYSGSFISAMARKKTVKIAFMHNQKQNLSLYPVAVKHFPVYAPTGIKTNQIFRLLLQPFEYFRTISKIYQFDPHIIHLLFSYPWFTATIPLLANKFQFAQTLHDITPHHGEESLRNYLSIKTSVRYADPVFVHGTYQFNLACKLYPDIKERLVRIFHGHFNTLNPSRKDLPEPEDATFLFFGRILQYKGLNIALKALEILIKKYPEAKMIIAGEGSIKTEMPMIQRLQNHLEIYNRRINDEALKKIMQRSLAVLAPYTHASASGMVTTSYAFCKPVIGSRIGGLIEMIIQDKTGWLFETKNPQDLAICMKKAVSDKARTIAMGRNARKYVTINRDWDDITEKCLNAYRNVLNRNGSDKFFKRRQSYF